VRHPMRCCHLHQLGVRRQWLILALLFLYHMMVLLLDEYSLRFDGSRPNRSCLMIRYLSRAAGFVAVASGSDWSFLQASAPCTALSQTSVDDGPEPQVPAEGHPAMAREHFYPRPPLRLSLASILDRASIFRLSWVTG